MKRRIVNLVKRAVKGYCKMATLAYPTGVLPMKRF